MEFLSDSEIELLAVTLDGRAYTTAKCLNRTWARVLSNTELRKQRFMRQWGVCFIDGEPRSPTLLETATLSSFSILHVLKRTDTLASLAVQYNCSVMQVKVTNNLSSDHALMSRKEVFIPVDCVSKIRSQLIKITYSQEAKREYLLVYPPDQGLPSEADLVELSQDKNKSLEFDKEQSPNFERVRRQLVIMMSRMFKIEHLVAEAYLSLADWDPHKAIFQYKQDENWQDHCKR